MGRGPWNSLHSVVKRIAATSWASKVLSRILHRLDRPILQLTQGRASLSGWLTGLPIISLTARGAKSGQPRTLPLVAVPDGEKLVLIASSYGRPRHPAWYHNLKAHPECQVTWNGRTRTYRAQEAEGPERERYWRLAVQAYPGYQRYQERAHPRRIPVLVLTPVEE